MAGVPTNFQAISNVLANYNFVDIASGTGYINFYAGKTVDLNLLSNNTYYSETLYTNGVDNSTSNYVNTLDIDFDILLNRPLDLKGLGIVNIPFYLNDVDSTGYAEVILRKWNGSTETDICTNSSREVSETPNYYMFAVDLNIPLTHFKIGETIRLTIKLYSKRSGAGTSRVGIAHDPKNRTTDGVLDWDLTGAVPSQLIFQCPVRLNL